MRIDLEGCGFVRALDKGCWEPTRRVKIFGLIVDMQKALVEIPEETILKVQKELNMLEGL